MFCLKVDLLLCFPSFGFRSNFSLVFGGEMENGLLFWRLGEVKSSRKLDTVARNITEINCPQKRRGRGGCGCERTLK